MSAAQPAAAVSAMAGMEGVHVYHVEFTLRARQPLGFGSQPGAQIRGALYNALSAQSCPIDAPPHPRGQADGCPVCYLLAREDTQAERGRDVPRPLIVQPPLGLRDLQPGESLVFGLKLIGRQAGAAMPLLVQAAEQAADGGFGQGRGQAALESIRAASAQGEWVTLSAPEALVQDDCFAISAGWVLRRAAELDPARLRLRFLTPLTLTDRGRTLRLPELGPLVRRIHERCQTLARYYASAPPAMLPPADVWRERYLRLGELADAAGLMRCDTRWVDVQSGSAVKRHWTPISGLVGEAVWHGRLGPLLPWLIWGELLHAGKNVTKGGGWLRAEPG